MRNATIQPKLSSINPEVNRGKPTTACADALLVVSNTIGRLAANLTLRDLASQLAKLPLREDDS